MPRSPKQKEAWARNKIAFMNGASLLPVPYHEVQIPHKYGIASEGRTILIYMRVPAHASAASPVPCVIQIFGLDDRGTELTHYADPHLARGWATIGVEIPGAGDCPALANDPSAPDRLWTSLLD